MRPFCNLYHGATPIDRVGANTKVEFWRAFRVAVASPPLRRAYSIHPRPGTLGCSPERAGRRGRSAGCRGSRTGSGAGPDASGPGARSRLGAGPGGRILG
eukprot:CAMPEP_0118878590 /NCGR_PEP_ID=MMETSP1163-20130328/18495_1 /TAXON_ID=124430 /ORGANISM="Phaeomonas parva, Strain CCMP2877" /LENGTH=99 /DNA_ID=CAMNT_0006814481 /DNA_START=134 /DNA_END=433 /DNA_ORIENTATION=+